jgi:hypothetical protein
MTGGAERLGEMRELVEDDEPPRQPWRKKDPAPAPTLPGSG